MGYFLLVCRKRKLYLRIGEGGSPIVCGKKEAKVFDEIKAQNVLDHLPKALQKMNFVKEPVVQSELNISDEEEIPSKKTVIVTKTVVKNTSHNKKTKKIIKNTSYKAPQNVMSWVDRVAQCNDLFLDAEERRRELLGKTSSGKDTVCNQLIQKGYKKLVTYTTRPMRPGEVQDETYHFISKEEFETLIPKGFFAEYTSYDTKEGTWLYGSAIDDYESNSDSIIILNPSGYEQILKNLNKEDITSFYIYSNIKTIKNRLKKRGDKKEEAARRIEADLADFKGLEDKVDHIVYNNDRNTIPEVVDKIISYLEEAHKTEG